MDALTTVFRLQDGQHRSGVWHGVLFIQARLLDNPPSNQATQLLGGVDVTRIAHRRLLQPLDPKSSRDVSRESRATRAWGWTGLFRPEPPVAQALQHGQPDQPGDDTNWSRRIPRFSVKSVTGPHLEPAKFAGRPHYQVRLRYREGLPAGHYDAGYHDVCQIKGRAWQMRGDGD